MIKAFARERAVRHVARRAMHSVLLATAAAVGAGPALAQDTQVPPPGTQEEVPGTPAQVVDDASSDVIVVEGIRETQRSSIQTKRNADVIVDAIVSDEIGALPDQSVGETLERIVGVTADRFKGSASEISIRGLGPFLGFSTLNGREVTSGSGDRAVSFQQFPSELVNGVLVYKSQSADLVEGGTSGIIDLRTLRPLDSGKSRIQADLRGVYEEYDDKIDGRDGLGYRASASYVDQFDLGDGEIGVSLGYSRADESAPEDFYTESSSVRPCNGVTAAGSNCSYNPNSGNPVYFVANNYLFRQMNNKLTRDAVMGTIQYRPRPELDINIDGQYSRRSWVENRSDFVVAEGVRGIVPGTIADNGALVSFAANSRLESQTRIRARDEEYIGGGFSVEWTDDAAHVGLDASYSETTREQVDRSTRLRTTGTTRFDSGNFTSGRIPYSLDKSSGEPVLTFGTVGGVPYDFTDHDNFTDAAYARRDSETRSDKIFAVRLDGEAYIADGFIRSILGGLRFSDHHRVADLDNQNRQESISTALTQAGNQNCRIDFREKDFLADSSSNIRSWASFDPLCLYSTFAGTDDAGPAADPRSTGDIDVTERIMAGYLMAKFGNESDTFAGNIGVRVLNTDVTSVGLRTAFRTLALPNGGVRLVPAGGFDTVTINNSFVNVLPSLNVQYMATPEFVIRGAIYRALSRPNIEDTRAGRDFVTDDTGGATLADAIAGVSGGNPRLTPLLSWNADLSFEYYPDDVNLLSLALFYKELQAGIIPADANAVSETFVIDGQSVTIPVAQQTNDNQKRDLYGLEATINHTFSYLPAPFDGLGAIVGYSYADTDFEYPDPSAVNPNFPLRLFTEPASIIGLSKHTLSATGYYERGPLSARVLYKFRSRYLKPFELNANRFAQPQETLDANLTYRLTSNLQLRLDVLNITNEPQILERPVPGAVSEVSYYGRKVYLGAKLRF